MHFAVNHPGHFLLANLLLPLILQASPSAHVFNVTSTAHHMSPMRFSDYSFDYKVGDLKRGKIVMPTDGRLQPGLWQELPMAFPQQ